MENKQGEIDYQSMAERYIEDTFKEGSFVAGVSLLKAQDEAGKDVFDQDEYNLAFEERYSALSEVDRDIFKSILNDGRARAGCDMSEDEQEGPSENAEQSASIAL